MSWEELQHIVDRLGIHVSHFCNLKREFDAFDDDQSGYIDIVALRPLLQQLGEEATEEKVEEALQDLDAENSGEVEFFEFVEWLVVKKASSSPTSPDNARPN